MRILDAISFRTALLSSSSQLLHRISDRPREPLEEGARGIPWKYWERPPPDLNPDEQVWNRTKSWHFKRQ